MTKEEAIKAMQTHRVRHRFFSKEEWVTQRSSGDIDRVLYGKLYLILKGV